MVFRKNVVEYIIALVVVKNKVRLKKCLKYCSNMKKFYCPNKFIYNIFVSFGGTLFQQVVGIPMGTNCATLLADLFLYSYESEFLQNLVKDKKIHEVRAFNFTYRYIDDVLSINNSRFAEFLPLIYPPEL